MVYAVYIAAAVAVALLIGFVVMSIAMLRQTVLSNIRSKTISLISVYDDLLDEKSRALTRLEADQEAEAEKRAEAGQNADSGDPAAVPKLKASEMMDIAQRAGGAMYRDEAMGGVYRKIRENFSFRLDDILPALRSDTEAAVSPAAELREALDYDTVWRLSTLPEESQLAVLRDTLSGEQAELLNAYLARHEKFNVLDFYENLRAIAELEQGSARLRVPQGLVPEILTQNGVEIIPDAGICEGFQLEEGNVLYDYCIKTRELS